MKRQLYLPLLITLLASVVFGVLPLGQPSTVYAAPDTDSVYSEGNSVSAGLTLTDSAYADGSTIDTWAHANGDWAKAPIQSWTFVMANSTLVSEGAITGVSLYLKHYQSGWLDDNFLIQIYDGSTWNTVRTYAEGDGPSTSNTNIDNWNVFAVIGTWTKVDAAQVRIIGNGQLKAVDPVDWFVDYVELEVTYTPPNISNTPSTWNLGVVSPNFSYETGIDYVLNEYGFRITNSSAFDVNITISAEDMGSGWLLADSPDTTHYALWAGTELTSPDYNIQVTSTGTFLITVLASSTRDWGLKLMTPTSFTDGGQKSGTVILTATQA